MVVMFCIFFIGLFLQEWKEKYYKSNTAGSKDGKAFSSSWMQHGFKTLCAILKVICKRMTIDQLPAPSTHPIQVLHLLKYLKRGEKKKAIIPLHHLHGYWALQGIHWADPVTWGIKAVPGWWAVTSGRQESGSLTWI